MRWADRIQEGLHELSTFPWRTTALTLGERFRADQLGLTAGSLTFTTTIALVPLVTVALAVFTAFPTFAQLQLVLQKWLIDSLIPDSISRQVLGYMTQFAGKASRLGWSGFAVLIVTALAMILTIDRSLNRIWRVRRSRPLGQRVLVYWAVLTLGPLLLAASLSATSYAITASRGWVGTAGGGMRLLFDLAELVLLAGGMAGLFRYVPNTRVAWSHALIGGLFVAIGVDVAKRLLALYLGLIPTYAAVYGAFATVPILLVWIYLVWVIVLLGAVIAAYLPSVLSGVARRDDDPGWRFGLAVQVLQLLQRSRAPLAGGVSSDQMARQLRADPLALEGVLETLKSLQWLGQVSAAQGSDEAEVARYLLLPDPAKTPLQPLLERLLLAATPELTALQRRSAWSGLRLADLFDDPAGPPVQPASADVR